ncbi:MAG: hypothetical protein LBK12_03450 [Odoribacteraceae bacterium]|jgi:hypothetical protein|nr:hypothetical protein [Odoribacteraceae bacterium]
MGTFLTITSELRYAGSFEANVKQNKVVGYISDNLQSMAWQESVSDQLQKVDRHHTSLSIILRLFHREDIEKGRLKSYARYIQKKDELEIDQMLVLDEYVDLPEDEMRKQLCDVVFDYVKELLIKYKARFQNFDAIAFISLFEERIKRIKNQEFEDDYYESVSFAMQKKAEEIKNKLNPHKQT